MRRLYAVLSACLLLVACGTSETNRADPSAIPPVAVSQAAYPTPAINPPTASPVATRAATNVPVAPPTVVAATPTQTLKPITATIVQSFALSKKQMPTTIIGWLPDDQHFLYTQISQYDQATEFVLGRVQIITLSTMAVKRIAENVVVGTSYNSDAYDINLPQWTETCCEIVLSSVKNGKQDVQIIDLAGQKVKNLKNINPSVVKYQQKKLVRVEKGKFYRDDTLINDTLISASGSITATTITNDGVWTHNNRDVQYIGNDGTQWTLPGARSFLKDKPDYLISRIDAAADSRHVALILAEFGSWKRELWVVDRETNEYRLIEAIEKMGYPRWSADAMLLAYTVYSNLQVVDLATGQIITVSKNAARAPVWHHTRPWLAMINEESQTIDIFNISR